MVGQFHCTVRGRQPLLDLNRVFAPLRVMSPQVRLNYIALPPAGWRAGWLAGWRSMRGLELNGVCLGCQRTLG